MVKCCRQNEKHEDCKQPLERKPGSRELERMSAMVFGYGARPEKEMEIWTCRHIFQD